MSKKNETRVQVIENATRDDVRPGDHITWERVTTIDGVTITTRYEGIARFRDEGGDWWTGGGMYITTDDAATLTIRRTGPELPTEDEAVIERADGHKYITAIFNSETYRAREAVLGADGWWHGFWRRATPAPHVATSVPPTCITPGTWKVEDQ